MKTYTPKSESNIKIPATMTADSRMVGTIRIRQFRDLEEILRRGSLKAAGIDLPNDIQTP